MIFVVTLVCLLSMLAVRCDAKYQNCPANEIFSDCLGNPMCQETCETYHRSYPLACPLMCQRGCICDEGLIRSPNGQCIPPTACPQEQKKKSRNIFRKNQVILDLPEETSNDQVILDLPEETSNDAETSFCPPNEFYTDCFGHPLCELSCENYKSQHLLLCPVVCRSGCVCEDGYVRGPDGICIRTTECPDEKVPSCPANESYTDCYGHPMCQDTCKSYYSPYALTCPHTCRKGCICEDELVRGPGGKCIDPTECPASSYQLEDQRNDCPSLECPPSKLRNNINVVCYFEVFNGCRGCSCVF